MATPEDKRGSQATNPDPTTVDRTTWFSRYEWLLIGLLVFIISLGTFRNWFGQRSEFHAFTIERGEDSMSLGPIDWDEPHEPRPIEPKDLNKVSRSDLLALPGIGPALADAILRFRTEEGGFEYFEDLDRVPGLGPSRLARLKPFLRAPGESKVVARHSDQVAEAWTSTENPSQESASRGGVSESVVSLNSMTLEQLIAIPGIGEIYADRILKRRSQLGGFADWDEVEAIPGIGPKRLENLRNHVRLDKSWQKAPKNQD